MAHEDQEKGSRRPSDGKTIEDRIKTGLEEELKRLRRLTGLGNHIELCWRPDGDSDRHGEVRENVIPDHRIE